MNSVTWTVLPNGRLDSGKLRLTVLATPSLDGGDSSHLGDSGYTLFHNWPASLTQKKAQWTITFRPAGGATGESAHSPQDPDFLKGLNGDMWQALFRSSVPVRTRAGNERYADSDVSSYPAAALNDSHRDHRGNLSAKYLNALNPSVYAIGESVGQTVQGRLGYMNLYLHPKPVQQMAAMRSNRGQALADGINIDQAIIQAQISARKFVEWVKTQDPLLKSRLTRDLARLERSIGVQVRAEVLISLVDHHQHQLPMPNPAVTARRAMELAQSFYAVAGIGESAIQAVYPQLRFALFHLRPELSISSIAPGTVLANRRTTLTVKGRGFREGFSASVAPAAPVSNLVFTDSMTVALDVTVTSAGTYALTIANPNGQTHTFNFQAVGAESALAVALGAENAANSEKSFHQVLSMVGQYPALTRPLGLAFDLEVDPPSFLSGTVEARLSVFDAGGPPSGSPFPSGDAAPVSLQTKFVIDATTFPAAPKDTSLLIGRMLNVANGFHLIMDDVDGSNLKDFLHAQGSGRAQEFQSTTAGDASDGSDSWPSARSGGISLLHDAREDRVKAAIAPGATSQQLTTAVTQGASTPPPLYAEDLVLGYRVDIWEDYSKQWYSLGERAGVYEFLDANQPDLKEWVPAEDLRHLEEGFVQLAATSPSDAQNQVQVHHSVFSFTGWSLSTPYPAGTMNPSQGPDPDKPLRMEPRFAVKEHSFPPLRFGVSYKARCRMVDLAGNSLPPTRQDTYSPTIGRDDPAHSGTPLRYQRWEPVRSPAVLLTKQLDPKVSPGEQMDRLVTRDGEGAAERFLVPPRVPQHFAEMHSKFDKHGLPDGAFMHVVLNPDGSFPSFSDSDNAAVAERNAYFHYDRRYKKLPNCAYFPDPLAEMARIRAWRLDSFGKRRNDGQVDFDLTIPFVNAPGKGGPVNMWPDVFPLRVRSTPVSGIAGEPGDTPVSPGWTWDLVDENDNGSRLCPSLTIPVRKAEVIEIEISCTLPDSIEMGPDGHADVEDCLVTPAITATYVPSLSAAISASASQKSPFLVGTHRLVSPPHQVTIVHAVRKPLLPLNFGPDFRVQRVMLNAKPADVFGSIQLDWFSTARLVCNARYTDRVDDLAQAGPSDVSTDEQAFEIKADETQDTRTPTAKQHAFRDTRYHEVTYRLTATSRFREYYPDRNEKAFQIQSEPSSPQTVNSSQRPAVPSIAYVIPSFGKEEGYNELTATRRRGRIGAIRVYLNRPWYSSGSKERLGVVYPVAGTANPDAQLADFVTRWGVDPIWKAGTLAQQCPDVNDFQGYVDQHSGCPLAEFPDPGARPVDVVGYEVHYDDTRQMWYCDVQLPHHHAYFPFVRMALVRFQPNSIDGAHISPVVLADFAQIAPNRWAHVQLRHKTASLCISGVTYASSFEGSSAAAIMQVTVQQRWHSAGKDLGWYTPDWGGPFRDFKASLHGEITLWEKQIELRHSPSLFKYRLIIEEYEQLRGDGDGTGNRHVDQTHRVERLVYGDVFEL